MKTLDPANVREFTISAVITRADGTVEHLGQIHYWHRNPVKRAWQYLKGLL